MTADGNTAQAGRTHLYRVRKSFHGKRIAVRVDGSDGSLASQQWAETGVARLGTDFRAGQALMITSEAFEGRPGEVLVRAKTDAGVVGGPGPLRIRRTAARCSVRQLAAARSCCPAAVIADTGRAWIQP